MVQSTKSAKGKKEYKYKIATAVAVLPSGEHKQIRAYGKTKREAESKLRVKLGQIERGEVYTNSKTPAMKFFLERLQAAQTNGNRAVGTSTYKDYEGRLERHFRPVFGELSLDQITQEDCEAVLARIQGHSQSDINKTYQLLKSGFRAAVDRGLIQRSPMVGVSKPRGTAGKRRSLTNDEYDRLRAAIDNIMAGPDNHPAAVFAAIAVGCGLRPGEVAALRWSNIKLTDNPTLTVAGAVKKGTRTIDAPKTEAGRRTIGIPSWLAGVLRQYRQERAAQIGEGHQFALLFRGHIEGWPPCEDARRNMWRTVREAAGIPAEVDQYCLRHTFCTRGAKAGVDLRTMRYLMGHESIEITAGIYTDITEDMTAQASAAFEALENAR